MVTQEQRQQFRQRLKDLQSYREQNPGMGYIEWKQSFQNGGIKTDENLEIAKLALKAQAMGYKPTNKGYTEFDLSQRAINDLTKIKQGIDFDQLKNIDYTMQALGYSINQRASLLGQMIQESRVQYDAKQIGGTGEGYIQISDAGRKQDLKDFTDNLFQEADTVGPSFPGKEQILWFHHINVDERNGKHHSDEWTRGKKNSWKTNYELFNNPNSTLMQVKDGLQDGYIRPGKPHDDVRIRATKLLEKILPKYGYPQYYQKGGQITPSYINHWTGKPISTGAVTPVVDLRTGADFTPVGDALAVKDAYDAAKNKDWSGMSWALASLIPFIPSSVSKASKLIKRPVPKVNKDYTEALWREKASEAAKHNQAISDATNKVYRVVERVMEDPAYIKRAEEVQKRFGDDYLTPYADMFAAYNIDPNVLPNVTVLDNNIITAGKMTKTADGKYVYSTNPNMDIPNVTEHELSHYTDLLKTGEYLNAEAGNNMFYQMSKDLNKKIDNNDNYFKNPSEQKAHMNQLREYLFQHGYISNRGEQIDPERMKQILKDIEKIDSMKSIRRAAKQFGSTKTYTKWFNSIPLLGLGVPALINDNKQE